MAGRTLHTIAAWFRSLAAARHRQQFEHVQAYCMFLGYSRSGHTLVGALLNAHPDAVIAQELDALYYVDRGFRRSQVYALLLERDRWFHRQKGGQWSGYNYAVPNQWQGRFRQIKVIGDKKGARSAKRIQESPHLLDKLRRLVGVPVRIVHHVRNPYDNIATMSTRRDRPLADAIDGYFGRSRTIAEVLRNLPADEQLTMRHEDLIASPAEHVKQLCGFVGLDCSEDFAQDCAGIVYQSPNQSRTKVEWTDALIEDVATRMQEFPFLSGYRYVD